MNKHFLSHSFKFFLTVLCTSLLTFAQAQVWTGDIDTDWTNPGNWGGGTVPTSGSTATVPASPQGGNFPIYGGNPIIDFTIFNAGTITFNSFTYNTGTIINFDIGQLVSNNFFVNAGKVVFDNDGNFDNNGIFENFGTFDNAASAIFSNNTSAVCTNHGTFTNFGNVNNNGSWINLGNTVSTNNFDNNGSLMNKGTFDNVFGSTFSNNSGGSVQIFGGATFLCNGLLNNATAMTNTGELRFNSGAIVTNDGTIDNQNLLSNSGQVFNNSTLNNNGTLQNNEAARIENNSNLQNLGTFENLACAILVQNAFNTITGTFINNGLIYEINGSVVVTGGEFGFVFSDINQTPPPVPGCKANVVVTLDETGFVEVLPDDIDKGAYGNCGAIIIDRTVTPSTFGIPEIGQQVVTLAVTDEFNLTSTCDAVITVAEFVPPITAVDDPDIDMTCPENITLTTLPGANTATATWTEPTGTSNCDNGGGPVDCSLISNSISGFIYMGEFNGSKYYCSETNDYTWTQAKAFAESKGGHLAVVNDAAENEFLRNGIMADFAWIGLTDEAVEGTFEWVTDEPVTYTNWNTDEPNNLNGNEHYTRLLKSNGKWTDRSPTFIAELIMEIPCGSVTSSCLSIPDNISGFIYMGEHNGSKYYCSENNATWPVANNACISAGGHLVVINDASENEFIRSRIMSSNAWIGLTDEAFEGTFEWVTGEAVSYTHWDAGQPNNYNGNEDYTRILQSNGKWTDRNETVSMEYVMEIPCGTNEPQTCALKDHGLADNGIADRLVWMDFASATENFEYTVDANGASFAENANGTATLTGTVERIDNLDYKWDFSVKLIKKRNWAEWSALGRTFKANENVPSDHTQWSFYEVDNANSVFTGQGLNAGKTLDITHNPVDMTFGFQVGLGANLKDGDYGISGWYGIAGDEIGRGDFNGDLDNCVPSGGGTGELVIEQIAGPVNGSEFFEGTTEVAYRGTDDCGNEEICVFEVIVNKTPSTITASCPADIVIDAAPGAESAVATWSDPTGTTDCFSSDLVTVGLSDSTFLSGAEFPVGTTFITYVFQDECGGFTNCTFAVTVNFVPATLTLLSCPQDIVTSENPVSWTEPTASTDCFEAGVNIIQTEGPANGSAFPIGTTRVSYLISDECGNADVCTFLVTTDGTPPPAELTLNCQGDFTVSAPSGSTGTAVNWSEPVTSTTCTLNQGIVTVTQTAGPANGSELSIGTTTISYEATDACDNVQTCSFVITVIEDSDPTTLSFFCPGDQIGRAGVGETSTVVTWTEPTASTTCASGNVYITQTDGLPNGSEFPVGTSMVTYEATDDCGNVETCTFKIMVTNDECNISSTVSNVVCDGSTFTFDLVVTGVGNPWGWTGGGQTVEYDVVATFGPYNISDGVVSFSVTDTDNPTCTDFISVDPTVECPSGSTCNTEILFVVGNSDLNTGDAAAKARLEALGFVVTVVDDDNVQTSDSDNKGLIVISATVSSGKVNTKFKNTAIPVVSWEAWLHDDMKMTGGSKDFDYGKYSYTNALTIVDAIHPIADGLSGTITVLTADKTVNWGTPSANAANIAVLPNDVDKSLLFAYETGDEMVGLTAPARRVGMFMRGGTINSFNNEAWQLFDAAIIWAADCPDLQLLVNNNDFEERMAELTLEYSAQTETDEDEIEWSENRINNTETFEQIDFSIFPNPATTITHLDLTDFVGKEITLSLLDQTGRLVMENHIENVETKTNTMNIHQLQAGIYYIRLTTHNQHLTRQLVVVKR